MATWPFVISRGAPIARVACEAFLRSLCEKMWPNG